MTAKRAVECAKCFDPLIGFYQLRSQQIPRLSAFIGAATGDKHSNLIKRKSDVLRLFYESHALYGFDSK